MLIYLACVGMLRAIQFANREAVKGGVRASWLGEVDDNVVSEITPATHTIQDDMTDSDFVGRTINGVILAIKHGDRKSVV